MPVDNFLFISFIFFFIYFFFKKTNFLNENIDFSDHKIIGKNNKTPILIGGIYIFIILLFFFFEISYKTKIIFFLFVLLGVMSDKNFLINPTIRLLLQLTFISFVIYLENLSISDLRIYELNSLLENDYFNFIFTLLCLAVLINGCNFIDGLNGLLSTYSVFIFLSIILVIKINPNVINFNYEIVVIMLFSLLLFSLFNFLGKVYLGDSGSYLVSIFLGYYLIQFFQLNLVISPYYIALLLWYPAFENLFSFLRRLINKIDISKPDKNHLHQLIFLSLNKKNNLKKKWINSFSSIIILFFTLPGFVVATLFPGNSKILISQLIINIFFYLLIYVFLFKNLKTNEQF